MSKDDSRSSGPVEYTIFEIDDVRGMKEVGTALARTRAGAIEHWADVDGDAHQGRFRAFTTRQVELAKADEIEITVETKPVVNLRRVSDTSAARPEPKGTTQSEAKAEPTPA